MQKYSLFWYWSSLLSLCNNKQEIKQHIIAISESLFWYLELYISIYEYNKFTSKYRQYTIYILSLFWNKIVGLTFNEIMTLYCFPNRQIYKSHNQITAWWTCANLRWQGVPLWKMCISEKFQIGTVQTSSYQSHMLNTRFSNIKNCEETPEVWPSCICLYACLFSSN